MVNRGFYLLFKLSITIPMLLIIGIVSLWIGHNIERFIICMVSVVVLSLAQVLILRKAHNSLESTTIKVDNIEETENIAIDLIFVFLIPIIQLITGDNDDVYILKVLLIVGMLAFAIHKKTTYNPIFKWKGLKTYYIQTAQGVTAILFTKNNLRNKKNVKRVKRIFENYYLED